MRYIMGLKRLEQHCTKDTEAESQKVRKWTESNWKIWVWLKATLHQDIPPLEGNNKKRCDRKPLRSQVVVLPIASLSELLRTRRVLKANELQV